MRRDDGMTTDETAPISVNRLHKSFGDRPVLNGMDLTIPKGEIAAILGRSGTGKSVFLRLLAGLEKPDSGSIRVHGKEVPTLDSVELNDLRKRMGFLFQHGALYDSLTVGENVAFPLKRHFQLGSSQIADRVQQLLAAVGMEHDVDKLPSQISGGMQKRVGLARALALDPEILLFDEPTSGLDPITSAEIGKLIVDQKRQRGITSIVVTHDIHGARQYADRLVLIHRGRVLLDGTFEDLRESPDEFAARFLSGVIEEV
jgi:phospholipid/cholesterol/gamma-HCH transport system ATP-binding protein